MTTTGQRLAAALQERGMTASELAREIDVTRAAVSLWIHDKASMTPENAKQVARVLEVSPRWLLTGEMRTPSGEWVELTPLEFEIIRTIRKYTEAQEPKQKQQKKVLKQYLNIDGTISLGE